MYVHQSSSAQHTIQWNHMIILTFILRLVSLALCNVSIAKWLEMLRFFHYIKYAYNHNSIL